MTPLRVLDLFSGIGGFSLGLERCGMRTVAFCETEPYCRRVLAKHWPEVPCYDDIRTLTAERLARDGIAVDVLCGGFPCQDLSVAGKGAGLAGARSGLWSEYRRLIRELEPSYVIIENVSALLSGADREVLPTDRCLCGWPYRWRRVPLDSEQGGSLVHSSLRYRDDGQGEADIGETEGSIRGIVGQSSEGDEEMGSGAALGGP